MRKLLLPIDGSERSLEAIKWVKSHYKPDEVEITLLIVYEDLDDMCSKLDCDAAKEELLPKLDKAAQPLTAFQVAKTVTFGCAGEEILEYAKDHAIDIVVMTKSTRNGLHSIIGSVTTHVVKYAHCVVVIVPEKSK